MLHFSKKVVQALARVSNKTVPNEENEVVFLPKGPIDDYD